FRRIVEVRSDVLRVRRPALQRRRLLRFRRSDDGGRCTRGIGSSAARRLVVACALTLAALQTPALAAPFGYVVNHVDGTVSVIDTATNAVVSTVTVGDSPLGAAVNAAGTRAYVTNQLAPTGTVSVIDTA